ncbi:MAG: response regulator transcription factor [Gammaproteobacteria bacterium]
MPKKAVMSYIGITPQELVLIKSFYKLIKWVQTVYEFKEFNATEFSDVLLVNADSKEAMDQWRMSGRKNTANTILISNEEQNLKGITSLKRPINIKKFLVKLENITSTELVHDLYEDIISESIKILVVDDSISVHKYLEHKLPLLSKNRIEMTFAETGKQAARKVKDNIYDIVFLDVMMPGVDGYKVCKWIKANSIAEVVMLTSRGSRFDKVRGAMSGCDMYLTKPPQDIKLREILDRRSKILIENNSQMVRVKKNSQI